ncbi:hypothetical protein [Pusillimonas sp. T7-7]|uniref:hypothetical protein n=1 Tax=Pusillimonas sp. (strain T7-7) TaxID=1007105 RepID=UPI0005A2ED8B|nr:hypothetical protein [Pusillimonas sp. T7-7]
MDATQYVEKNTGPDISAGFAAGISGPCFIFITVLYGQFNLDKKELSSKTVRVSPETGGAQ